MESILQVECASPVTLERTVDGTVQREQVGGTMQLKKEFGNARLVADDQILWTKGAHFSMTDATSTAGPVWSVSVGNAARRFYFDLHRSDTSNQFLSELQDQIEGNDARRKVQKIRKTSTDEADDIPDTIRSPKAKRKSWPMENNAATPSKQAVQSPFRSPFRRQATPNSSKRTVRSAPPLYTSPRGAMKRKERGTPEEEKTQGKKRRTVSSMDRFVSKSNRSLLDDLNRVPNDKAETHTGMTQEMDETELEEKMMSPTKNNYPTTPALPSVVEETSQDIPEPTPPKCRHGLLNLGNFCYMNVILQSLSALPHFSQESIQHDDLITIIRKQLGSSYRRKLQDEDIRNYLKEWKEKQETPVSTELEHLIDQVVHGSETSINPEPLKMAIGRQIEMFASSSQQDAHEFLISLLDVYEKELVTLVRGVCQLIHDKCRPRASITSTITEYFRSPAAPTMSDEDLTRQLLPAKSLQGELKRTLTCTECGDTRQSAESFTNFSLDLPRRHSREPTSPSAPQCYCGTLAQVQEKDDGKFRVCQRSQCSFMEKERIVSPSTSTESVDNTPIPLEEVVRKQFEMETLELRCEKCPDGVRAECRHVVKSLPPTLVFHLKRFEMDFTSGELYKRCDAVKAPKEIRPRPCVDQTEDEKAEVYALKSIVHHIGRSIGGGHYIADVCGADGVWRRRNDTIETVISEEFALEATHNQESCYLLFYVRVEASGDDKENARSGR